jgi:hypothetical protein
MAGRLAGSASFGDVRIGAACVPTWRGQPAWGADGSPIHSTRIEAWCLPHQSSGSLPHECDGCNKIGCRQFAAAAGLGRISALGNRAFLGPRAGTSHETKCWCRFAARAPDCAKVFAKNARAKRIALLRVAVPEIPPRPFHLCSDRAALHLGKRGTTPGNFDFRRGRRNLTLRSEGASRVRCISNRAGTGNSRGSPEFLRGTTVAVKVSAQASTKLSANSHC